MRLRRSAWLKIVRGWDSMQRKYCKCLPVSYFSLGMGLWPLLEAGTGQGRPFVWTKTSTHTSSYKSQGWGRRQSCWSPAQRQQSLNVGPGKMTWLEISWSYACLGPSETGPEICLACLSFLILLKPWSHLFPENFALLLWQAGSLPLLFCISISEDLRNVLVESVPL